MRTAAAAALVAAVRLSTVANRLSVWGFQATSVLQQRQPACRRTRGPLWGAATPEETAQAMSEYLARTHEEKLKTAHEIREKDAEIEKLKKELTSAQEASPGISASLQHDLEPAPHAPVLAGARTEDLVSQIAAYQKFMSDYIVRAQEEKLRAVKNAEQMVEKKYQEKMLLLTGGQAAPVAAAAAGTAPATAALPSPETALYAGRSAKVEEAAKAGKSRWGVMEVGKASEFAANAGVTAVAAASPPPAAVATPPPPTIRVEEIPAEVIEADHGLRAEGNVGGLSLAERVLLGSQAATAAVVPSAAAGASALATADTSVYMKRNARVSEAAKAGKSRWGPMEVAKVTALAQAAPPPPPAIRVEEIPAEVIEADHGLRAEGNVGGLSLAERVLLGSQAATAAVVPSAAAGASALATADTSVYMNRNAKISEAAKAGKSRWGPMEVAKVTALAQAAPPMANNNVAPVVWGGGAPSLSDRVNLGAQLVGR